MNEDREEAKRVLIAYLDATIAFRETIELHASMNVAQGLVVADLMNQMNTIMPQMLCAYVRMVLFGKEDKARDASLVAITHYCDTANQFLEEARKMKGIALA